MYGEVLSKGNYYHYFSDDGLHAIGSIQLDYRATTTFSYTSSLGSDNDTSYEYDSYGYNARFRGAVGVGFGRIRDGTFVFHAIRIIERLKDDGVITVPITNEQTLTVINRLASKKEYTTNYERYEKFLIQDILDELIEEGVITLNSVNPISIFKVQETFRERIQTRRFGWRLYYLFHDQHDQALSDSPTFHKLHNDWVYIHEIGIEGGYPLSLFTHAQAWTKVQLPFNDIQRKFQIDAYSSISYEVGERVDISISYQFTRSATNYTLESGSSGAWEREIRHSIQGNFVYFIEDYVSVNNNVGYVIDEDNYFSDFNSYYPYYHRSSGFSASIGLKYNLF